MTADVDESLLRPSGNKMGNGKGKKGTAISLYLSGCTASLVTFGMGTVIVWTSPVISRLRSNDTSLNPLGVPITTIEESVIGSLGFVGASLGCLLLTKLCDYIGRRRTLMGLAGLMLIAYLALALARHIFVYYISRFTLGFCMGGGLPIAAIFSSEISENHNRGKICTIIGLSIPMGNLYVYVIGPLLDVQVFTLLCALPYVVLILSFACFVPESPIYLASKDRRAEALTSLKKLRNNTPSELEKEYESIISTLEQSTNEGKIKDFLNNKGLRKGLLIAVMANLIQQLSGVSGLLAFAGPLFDAAHMNISGNITALLIGMVKLCSVFLTMAIVDRVGKRPLLLISTLGCSISHFLLGLFYYLLSINHPWVKHILWLPVVTVLLYFIFYGIGLGAIVPSLTSELFPSNAKVIPGALGNFTNFFTCVIITSTFPVFLRSLGAMWCLWGFSVFCLFGFVFVYFVMPEIKGRSVLEILDILSK